MRWNEGTDGDEGDDNLCKYILKLVLGISEKKSSYHGTFDSSSVVQNNLGPNAKEDSVVGVVHMVRCLQMVLPCLHLWIRRSLLRMIVEVYG